MSQPDKIFGLVKFLLKLFSQFRGEGCKILLTQTDHQKGSGNHIVGFAMLIPQGAVQGQPHQLAIIVVDDGKFAPLTMSDMFAIQKYLETASVTLMVDEDALTCICID